MKFLKQITPRQHVNGYGGNADSKAMAGTSGDLIKLTNTDKFARESLQNSCDASQSNFTSIKIRSISFNDALRRNYEEELAINSFLKPRIDSNRNDFPSIEDLMRFSLLKITILGVLLRHKKKLFIGTSQDFTNSFLTLEVTIYQMI